MGHPGSNGQAVPDGPDDQGVATRFRRPGTLDEAAVTGLGDAAAPGTFCAHWITPGAGRAALNQLLGELLILEVDHVATAAAEGQSYRVAPLRELAQRGGWTLDSQEAGAPTSYALTRDGETTPSVGPRSDLLLILELLLRCALRLFEGQSDVPSWVQRARHAHPKLLVALEGEELLQPRGCR